MINSLIILLVLALVAWVVWKKILGAFIADAQVMNIIGLIIGLLLLVYALRLFNVHLPG